MRCTSGLAHVGLETKPQHFQHDLVKLAVGLVPNVKIRASPDHDEDASIATATTDAPITRPRLSPNLEVRPSPDRGVGLFATERIPAYSKILEDEALLSLARGEDLPELWGKYCTLPPDLRDKFSTLSLLDNSVAKEGALIDKLEQRGYATETAKKMARVNSRWQANAFKTGGVSSVTGDGNSKWAYALFPMVARINHSCTPNAHSHYRPVSGAQQTYALRDIEKDEEVEIGYFDITMTSADRHARAKSWDFQCSCRACSHESAFTAYEQRLALVHQHLVLFESQSAPEKSADSIQTAIAIAHSHDYPWLVLSLPRLYHNLAELEKSLHGRKEKIGDALEKALEWEIRITGADSPSSEQRKKDVLTFKAQAGGA